MTKSLELKTVTGIVEKGRQLGCIFPSLGYHGDGGEHNIQRVLKGLIENEDERRKFYDIVHNLLYNIYQLELTEINIEV